MDIPEDATTRDIVKQVEFYFSDLNLRRDKYLQEQIYLDAAGWVPAERLVTFNRLAKLAGGDPSAVISALKHATSGLLEVNEELASVRRSPANPIPKWDEPARKELEERTVYVKGFDKSCNIDALLRFFDDFDRVSYVHMRRYVDKRAGGMKKFKGSVFVSFLDRSSAEAFMAKESVRNAEGEVLTRKWQKDYFAEKTHEREHRMSKFKKKFRSTKENKPTNTASTANECKLPKGAVVEVTGLSESNTREELKKALMKAGKRISFMEHTRGSCKARVRFANAGDGSEVARLLEQDNTTLVGNSEVKFRVLDGDEETEYLATCAQAIRQMATKRKASNEVARTHGKKRRNS